MGTASPVKVDLPEAATSVGCIRDLEIRAEPYNLCYWAAMHRLRYQASRLTQAVRSGQAEILPNRIVDLRPGTHPTHN